MKRIKSWWIKERANPQTGTYYVPCGQLSRAAAKRKEESLYGDNFMHEYASEADYTAKLAQLRRLGKRIVA